MSAENSTTVPRPWTCEFCGCHTNTSVQNPSTCGICGTSRRGLSLLRRAAFPLHHQLSAMDYDDNESDNVDDDDDEDEEEGHDSSEFILQRLRRRQLGRGGERQQQLHLRNSSNSNSSNILESASLRMVNARRRSERQENARSDGGGTDTNRGSESVSLALEALNAAAVTGDAFVDRLTQPSLGEVDEAMHMFASGGVNNNITSSASALVMASGGYNGLYNDDADGNDNSISLRSGQTGHGGLSSNYPHNHSSSPLSRRRSSVPKNSLVSSPMMDHAALLTAAMKNSSLYNPTWEVSPALLSSPVTVNKANERIKHVNRGNFFETDQLFGKISGPSSSHTNVVYIEDTEVEGCVIRATQRLPCNDIPPSLPPRSIDQPRNIYGFRVAFDRVNEEAAVEVEGKGGDEDRNGIYMGGCCFVGIATSGSEQGIDVQQSQCFWGLEDGGRRYEGGHRNKTPAGRKRDDYDDGLALGLGLGLRSSDGNGYLQPASGPRTSLTVPSMGSHSLLIGGGGTHTVPGPTSRQSSRKNPEIDALFGYRETVTVVVDLDSRVMMFWKEDFPLGIVVRNLPSPSSSKMDKLYPVVVPLHGDVSVAITGLGENPLPVLSKFHELKKKELKKKVEKHRDSLVQTHSKMIKNNRQLTQEMISILTTIFSWYTKGNSKNQHYNLSSSIMSLEAIPAAKLWYRCGMKLSHLNGLLSDKNKSLISAITTGTSSLRTTGVFDVGFKENVVTLNDFLDTITLIVKDDEKARASFATIGEKIMRSETLDSKPLEPGVIRSNTMQESNTKSLKLRVGDKVELVTDYKEFGDAQNGPLRTGDRGTIDELYTQKGPKGNRVLHSGRRWWYSPKVLISERSGLIESLAVRFLQNVLRSHGYNENTFMPFWGDTVTTDSWQAGDLVIPTRIAVTKKVTSGHKRSKHFDTIGRIVVSEQQTPLLQAKSLRKNEVCDSVEVEYANTSFSRLAGALGSNSPSSASPSLFTKTFKARTLIHTTFHHGIYVCDSGTTISCVKDHGYQVRGCNALRSDSQDIVQDRHADDISSNTKGVGTTDSLSFVVNESLQANLVGVAQLDFSAIKSLINDCEKNITSLPGLFSAGLPDAVLSGIDFALDKIIHVTKGDKVEISCVELLCRLAITILRRLFLEEELYLESKESTNMEQEDPTDPFMSQEFERHVPNLRESQSKLPINSSPPSQRGNNDDISSLSLFGSQHLRSGNESPARQPSSLRELIRDLGADQRRNVILALLSSHSGNSLPSLTLADSTSLSNGHERDYGALIATATDNREEQMLSSFGTFSASQNSSMHGGWTQPSLNSSQGTTKSNSDDLSKLLNYRMVKKDDQKIVPGSVVELSSPAGNSTSTIKESDAISSLLRGSRNSLHTPIQTKKSLHSKKKSSSRMGSHLIKPTHSLIHNGLLLNKLDWVEKVLGVQKFKSKGFPDMSLLVDEDGFSIIQLAVIFGCSTSVLNTLMKAGCCVTDEEVIIAANTRQTHTLEFLLRHTVYQEGTIDIATCSLGVANVLQKAVEKQNMEERKMKNDAGRFASSLFYKLINLALRVRLLSTQQHTSSYFDKYAKVMSDTIVGKILLDAMHQYSDSHSLDYSVKMKFGKKQQIRKCVSRRNRKKFSASSPSITNGSFVKGTVDGATIAPSRQSPILPRNCVLQLIPSSVIDNIIPTAVLVEGVSTPTCVQTETQFNGMNSINEKSPASTHLMRLLESYLWTKDMADIAVGLALLRQLLRSKSKMSYDEFERYGIKELLIHHSDLACDLICELENSFSLSSSHEFVPSTVSCPKGHSTVLLLTKHSQFRCDLCNKGVEQGQPMHGCRKCDWDACQTCTDKREGGYVKWKYIHKLALECQHLLSALGESYLESEKLMDYTKTRLDELRRISRRILQWNHDSIIQLSKMLRMGEVTFHEFSSVILPSLHSVVLGDHKTSFDLLRRVPVNKVGFGPYRRSKKARVAVASNLKENHRQHKEFLQALVDNLMTDRPLDLKNLLDCQLKNDIAIEENEKDAMSVDEESKIDIKHKNHNPIDGESLSVFTTPPFIQYVHTLLSFYQQVKQSWHRVDGESGSELQSLLLPFDIELRVPPPSLSELPNKDVKNNLVDSPSLKRNILKRFFGCEPLLSLSDLRLHILRTCPILNERYRNFCRCLVSSSAIIAEISKEERQFAQIIAYDEMTGAHRVKYVSFHKSVNDFIKYGKESSYEYEQFLDRLEFNGKEVMMILAVRNYCILRRKNDNEYSSKSDTRMKTDASMLPITQPMAKSKETLDKDSRFMLTIGTRLQSNVNSVNNVFSSCSIIASKLIYNHANTMKENKSLANSNRIDPRYTLVLDTGEVFFNVQKKDIKSHDILVKRQQKKENGTSYSNETRNVSLSAENFFLKHRPALNDVNEIKSFGILKRSWSALSLTKAMSPIDLGNASKINKSSESNTFSAILPMSGIESDPSSSVVKKECLFEANPILSVQLYVNKSLEPINCTINDNTTLFGALQHLSTKDNTISDPHFTRKVCLDYAVSFSLSKRVTVGNSTLPTTFLPPWINQLLRPWPKVDEFQSNVPETKRSFNSLGNFGNEKGGKDMWSTISDAKSSRMKNVLCQGICEKSLQCMDLLSTLAEYIKQMHDNVKNKESETLKSERMKNFHSDVLTKILTEQLDDPLIVVGGALPEWCTLVPSYAPFIFDHKARRLLLERTVFGVSRSALRQQEAKVTVASQYRKRMSSLRNRAVELVGEAFSGGAADPTALQLQADELYGMEETLKTRLSEAFKVQRWEERSLECVKASVCRDTLLKDAAIMMEKYSNNNTLKQRRLEIRFEGESGFDAASGDEAGVTRGFYADIAEALLKCDHVAGVFSLKCPKDSGEERKFERIAKLPLWIPDTDPSHSVILPTPRSNMLSTPGVYPRPLSQKCPQHRAVLDQFRLIGRLFASAMRDNFIFPLPLCTSFLKVVQAGTGSRIRRNLSPYSNTASSCSSSVTSCNSIVSGPSPILSTPTCNSNMSMDDIVTNNGGVSSDCTNSLSDFWAENKNSLSNSDPGSSQKSAKFTRNRYDLSSDDLPRPGFLGGEVFAVEEVICSALDNLEKIEHILSHEEFRIRKLEIGSDNNFARKALGRTFDCSFDEYFEDRTFVDPLDPEQGQYATPLCFNGHLKTVDIDNVREWVYLAKQFILSDGIIAQACSFREGVNDLFPVQALCLFTAEELQHDVCGSGDNVDNWDEKVIRSLLKLDGGKGSAEALVAVAAMGGQGGAALSKRFGPTSPTIKFLVKALLNASSTKRRQFLSFVTSVPIVTPGQIEIVPIVDPKGDFIPFKDPGCLPRANTCARKLFLPKFDNCDSFSQIFWAIIQEECRFKGFYEWRG